VSQSFPKSKRIVRSGTFTLVLRRGRCAADGCLVVFAIERDSERSLEGEASRLGVTIPKKTGNAVVRNRWKRWIREAFRTQQVRIPSGFDYVVRPKKGAVGDWATIRASLPRLARRAANARAKRTNRH
jgi:ribonuclease P protein component